MLTEVGAMVSTDHFPKFDGRSHNSRRSAVVVFDAVGTDVISQEETKRLDAAVSAFLFLKFWKSRTPFLISS